MTTRPSPVRSPSRTIGSKPRADLSRALIVEKALELIDTNGLEALNMRDLGEALGSATMSVYRHFRNKAELLDAVVDQVVVAFMPTGPQQDWRIEARESCRRVRRAMVAHPELADVIGREIRRSNLSLKVNIEIIDRLRAGGMPDGFVSNAYWFISSYTTGFALLEAQALRRRRIAGAWRSLAQRTIKIAGLLAEVEGVSPTALEAAAPVLARPLDDAQFEFGLDCVIRGVAELIANTEAPQAQA